MEMKLYHLTNELHVNSNYKYQNNYFVLDLKIILVKQQSNGLSCLQLASRDMIIQQM